MKSHTSLRWSLPLLILGLVASCTESHTPVASPVANPGARSALGEVSLDHAGPLARVSPLLRGAFAEAQAFGDVSDALRERINVWRDPADRMMVDVIVRADLPMNQGLVPQARGLGMNVIVVQDQTRLFMGSTPIHRLPDLAALAGVTRVEVARPMNRQLDQSIPASSPINSMNRTTSPTDGAGTVVGVVDTGIDYTHNDFRDPTTGLTRIRYIWDQTDCTNANPPVAADSTTFGCNDTTACGSEYTADQINCMLDPTIPGCGALDPVGQQDTDSHGTHVTSTAAGNGGDGVHIGVAPAADIVVVKFDFDDVCNRNSTIAINEGIRYIFERADGLGLPAAVNLSLGSDLGPHTGDEGGDVAMDALTGPGHVVVAAAGNAARNAHPLNLSVFGHPIHGSGPLSDGVTSTITLDVPSYTAGVFGENYFLLDIWFGHGALGTADVVVRTPGGRSYSFNAGRDACKNNGRSGRVCVFNTGADPFWELAGDDNEIWVQIDDGNGFAPDTGTWTVEITGDSVPGGSTDFHSWMATSRNLGEILGTYPSGSADNDMTVGSPAVADNALAVAAYTTRDTWTDFQLNSQGYGQAGSQVEYYGPMPVNALTFFSSRGGRRGDATLKPEITAPGAGIIAAFSHWTFQDEAAAHAAGDPTYFYPGRITDDGPADDGFDAYTVLQGTSMATPHATGGVALLLAQDPTLTAADIRAIWSRTAVDEGATGSDYDWGWGRFDLDAAIADVSPAGCTVHSDCDDSDLCTTDTCGGGACSNTPMVCDDANACTTDSCDPGTGMCVNPAIDCDDGDACTGTETCDMALGCQAGTPIDCDDSDACTVDSCNPTDGSCGNAPITCDDGDACNGAETCDAALGCQSGSPVDCSDGDLCTSDDCNPSTGACTNPPVVCSDGDDCTSDACDGATGACVYTPLGTPECSCSSAGGSCTSHSDCCGTLKCRGRSGSRSCR